MAGTIEHLNGIVGVPSYTHLVTFLPMGDQNPVYPVTNLGSYELGEPWRSPSLVSPETSFQFTLAEEKVISLIVLCRHNLSFTAKWRVRLWDATNTLVYDSGLVSVWNPVYDPLELEWEDDNFWDCTYREEDIVGYPLYVPMLIDDLPVANLGQVDIEDPDNTNGFVQISTCEIASHWMFTYNYAPGATIGFQGRSKYSEADGGARYYKRLPKPRTFSGALKYVPIDEVMSKAFEHQRVYDTDRPFFWWPEPLNYKDTIRTAYLARNDKLDLISLGSALRNGDVAISYIEVL